MDILFIAKKEHMAIDPARTSNMPKKHIPIRNGN
jgi:hypothetical protein